MQINEQSYCQSLQESSLILLVDHQLLQQKHIPAKSFETCRKGQLATLNYCA